MTKEKKLLIDFINWLRKDYEVEEVYEMYADEFLQDVAKTNSDQPDVSGLVCDFCLDTYRVQTHDVCERCRKLCGD